MGEGIAPRHRQFEEERGRVRFRFPFSLYRRSSCIVGVQS
jgi:hypothetical protein